MVDSKENYKFDLRVKWLMKELKMNEKKKKTLQVRPALHAVKKFLL